MTPVERFDVAVLGSLHLDIMVEGATLPREDETVVGRSWRYKCGGKGGNQAVAAARFGARTMMLGRVGNDDFGRRLLANLAQCNIDHSRVAVDQEVESGMSIAIVDETGAYGAAVVSGANQRLAGDSEILAPILLLQNEVPEAANIAVARAAKGRESTVILNAAPMRPISEAMISLVDLLIVNRIEAAMFVKRPVDTIDAAMEAALELSGDRRAVIITLGSAGSVLKSPGSGARHVPARPVEVVSTHGAGDCFVGALAARLAADDNLVHAVRFATAAAGLFVARDDAAQSLLGVKDIAIQPD